MVTGYRRAMQPSARHPFRWPLSIDAVWLFMPIFVVAIRTLLQPIPMEDYWWHLAMGRLVDAGTLPSTNLFLYTLPVDAPFYNQPWLAQWLMFLIAEHLSHIAMVMVHTALLLLTFVALVAVTFRRGASPMVVGITASLAYYLSASTLMPRTQMFAYPLFVVLAVALLSLSNVSRSGAQRVVLIAILVGATAFWANVHGTFVLAPILTAGVAIASLLQARRRDESVPREFVIGWCAAVFGVAAATALSPGGLQNLMYPVTIFFATKGHAATVLEWQSPSPASLTGLLFYGAVAGSAWVLFRQRARVTLQEVALLLPVTLIAVGSVRGVLWWALASVIVVAPHLAAIRQQPERPRPTAKEGILNAALLGGLTSLVLMALPGAPLFNAVDPAALFGDGRLGEDEAAVLSELNPAGLLDDVSALDGRLFHHQAVGGFLEWTLTTAEAPIPVAFIDQRLELLPGHLWTEYFTISRLKPGWRELVERHDITAFLVDGVEQELLEKHLSKSPDHRLVAEDRMWRLYVEVAPTTK